MSKYNNTRDQSGYGITGYSRVIYFDKDSKKISKIFEGYIENSEPSSLPFYGREFLVESKECHVGFF